MSQTPIIGGGNQPATNLVKDATIETFQADVLEASMKVPVVVDFWASWCGPCKTLGPMLEKAIEARGGKVLMVKVDTDKNQMLAQQLRIQSLPTVMAFVAGQPIDGFMGAVPESELTSFLDRVMAQAEQMGLPGGTGGPDPSDILAAATEALGTQDFAAAISAFAQVAEMSEPGSDPFMEALAGIAMTQLAAGDRQLAEGTLTQVPADRADHPALAQIKAQLALSDNAADEAELARLRAAHDANPANPEAAMALAEGQIAAGQMEHAVQTLLDMIERDQEWGEGAAKAKLLTVFEALGPMHPDVKKGRRRLSSLLFS